MQFEKIEEHEVVPVKMGILRILNLSFKIGSCFGMILLMFEVMLHPNARPNIRRIVIIILNIVLSMMTKALNKIKRNHQRINED